LIIAGSEHVRFPNYARELKSQFSNMAGIQWLGQTSEDDVMELFRHAQIIVLPYTASTGSSSVLYQAATWGRPVVASNLSEIKKLALESDLQVEFLRMEIFKVCAPHFAKYLIQKKRAAPNQCTTSTPFNRPVRMKPAENISRLSTTHWKNDAAPNGSQLPSRSRNLHDAAPRSHGSFDRNRLSWFVHSDGALSLKL
jgi:hypothetical protein